MRRLAAIAFVLFLAGCGGGTGADLIKTVQDATVKACGFLPVASTVAAIIDTLAGTGGAATMAAAAAKGICTAVKPSTHALVQTEPTFNGVKIEGEFVDPDKEK